MEPSQVKQVMERQAEMIRFDKVLARVVMFCGHLSVLADFVRFCGYLAVLADFVTFHFAVQVSDRQMREPLWESSRAFHPTGKEGEAQFHLVTISPPLTHLAYQGKGNLL